MTFIPEARIERRSLELLTAHGLKPGFDVEALVDQLDLGLVWDELNDEAGAVVLGALRPTTQQVFLNERHLDALEANLGLRRFTLAHEIGHWFLHCDAARSGAKQLLEFDRILCRDGSSEPAEIQANRFAAYLLMPTAEVREARPKKEWKGWPVVYDLAKDFAVTPTAMFVRLQSAKWAHRGADDQPASGPPPDKGQGSLLA